MVNVPPMPWGRTRILEYCPISCHAALRVPRRSGPSRAAGKLRIDSVRTERTREIVRFRGFEVFWDARLEGFAGAPRPPGQPVIRAALPARAIASQPATRQLPAGGARSIPTSRCRDPLPPARTEFPESSKLPPVPLRTKAPRDRLRKTRRTHESVWNQWSVIRSSLCPPCPSRLSRPAVGRRTDSQDRMDHRTQADRDANS
jgi:hypothetical protein